MKKEAADRLEELIEHAKAGECVVISRDGQPVAQVKSTTAGSRPDKSGDFHGIDLVWRLARECTSDVQPESSSTHDDHYDKDGLPT